jgi:hypothetical protein
MLSDLRRLCSYLGLRQVAVPDDPWSISRADGSVVYDGFIRARGPYGRRVAVQARIVEWAGLPTEVFLHDPPGWLRQHPHGPCLQLMFPPQSRWFTLHFTRPPTDAESARAYVHQMIAEAAKCLA